MKRSSLEEMNIFEYCLFLHTKTSPIKYDFNSSVLIRIVRNLRKMGWILIVTFYLKFWIIEENRGKEREYRIIDFSSTVIFKKIFEREMA